MDAFLYEKARTGNTSLPRRSENAGDGPAHRIVYNAIVEDDVRRFAAEFERDLLEALGRKLVHARVRDGSAGEGNLRHFWMGDERLTHHGAVSRHHVDNARRNVRLADDEAHEFEE